MDNHNTQNRKQKRNRVYVNIAAMAVLVITVLVIDASLLFSHENMFSEKENRVLQTAPTITADTLFSGKFMTEFEDFASDQILWRDRWISYHLGSDRLLGRKEAGDVYLGRNGYLIEKASPVDKSNFARNLSAISSFAKKNADKNIVMTVVPNAVTVCPQYVPRNAPRGNQAELIARISQEVGADLTFTDVTSVLDKCNDEYIYYKSDHHWTSLGAKYAFGALKAPLGIIKEEPYTMYYVANDFSGTLSAASGAGNIQDNISVYIPTEELEYVVEYVGENRKSATVFDSAALETSSKYDVFFGGNHALVKIKVINDSQKNLLVIKDSYANAMIPFLLPYYRSISIVDPRYYSDSIDKLIEDGQISDILFLYNMNTFVQDNSIAGVLADE